MNILFVTSAAPKVSPFFMSEKRPPLGLGTLISVTRNAGHRVFFIDNFLKPSNFIEEGFIQKNNIDFVAISVNTACYHESLRMFGAIEKLRRKGSIKAKMIVGGPHTAVALNTIPEFVDYIVQGEGEEAILDIINGKTKERVLKKPRIKDLDSLPFLPWDIFSKLPYNYICPWIEEDVEPVFTMNTSRGCPLSCAFCSVSSIWGKDYTYFSAERIVSEIEYLIKNYGAKGVFFREDNFTLNSKRTIEFCEQLIKKNIDIYWGCETRVDSLCDEQLVKLMRQSGCRSVYLGVESGSQRILDFLSKNISLEQIEKGINLCKENDINVYCSLIVGVPGETYEDYLLTKRMMEKLKPFRHKYNVFKGVIGSHLYKYVWENKIYEHVDDLGTLYMPGFDIKAEFFYKINSRCLVNYRFRQRTDYDKKLLRELRIEKISNITFIADKFFSFLPVALRKRIKKILTNILFRFFV
ncbi:MAG: B12-binding domain-containing radical SAM protein [Candidatus Omnitrophica bacterium]|nr:B12-binding domain-containing radical SAM protein [Candidatus Omnitrophota bacterium]